MNSLSPALERGGPLEALSVERFLDLKTSEMAFVPSYGRSSRLAFQELVNQILAADSAMVISKEMFQIVSLAHRMADNYQKTGKENIGEGNKAELLNIMAQLPVEAGSYFVRALKNSDQFTTMNKQTIVTLKSDPVGGIDLNAANLNLLIMRDGKGIPLPLIHQDMAQLNRIAGFEPFIIDIKPLTSLPLLKELQQKSR